MNNLKTMSYKVEKDSVKFVAKYKSFFAPAGMMVLLLGFWFLLLRNFSLSSLFWLLILTPFVLWIMNISIEGFHFAVDSNQVQLRTWHKYYKKEEHIYNYSLQQIKGLKIERSRKATKRLLLMVENKTIPFTTSFVNTDSPENLAKEIAGFFAQKGIRLEIQI